MLTFLTSAALHPSVLWMYIFLFSAPANSALYPSNGTSLPKFCTCKVGVDGQEILMKDYTVLRYGTFRKLGPLFDWKIIKFVRINIINILRKNKTTWAIMKVFCKFEFQDLSFQHHLWWLFLRGFVCYLLSVERSNLPESHLSHWGIQFVIGAVQYLFTESNLKLTHFLKQYQSNQPMIIVYLCDAVFSLGFNGERATWWSRCWGSFVEGDWLLDELLLSNFMVSLSFLALARSSWALLGLASTESDICFTAAAK